MQTAAEIATNEDQRIAKRQTSDINEVYDLKVSSNLFARQEFEQTKCVYKIEAWKHSERIVNREADHGCDYSA